MGVNRYSKREVQRIMKQNNFKLARTSGRHAIYKNEHNRHISVTTNGCNGVIMQRLIKENNLRV